MSGTVWFRGLNLSIYGLRIGGVRPYQAPGRKEKTFSVPGKIGEIYPTGSDESIPNEIREYSAALYMRNATPAQVEVAMAKVRAGLLRTGYQELRDSYEPDFYRRAFFYGDFEPARKGAGQNYQATLRFSCDPRRFFRNVSDTIMDVGGADSVTFQPYAAGEFLAGARALPLIKVEGGSTAFALKLQEYGAHEYYGEIAFAATNRTLWFDAETLCAWSNQQLTAPANELIEDVIGDIYLSGTARTVVERTDTGAKVTITPRWWVR